MAIFFTAVLAVCAFVVGKDITRNERRRVGRQYYRKNGYFADQAPRPGPTGVRMSGRRTLPLGRPFRLR